VGRAARSIFIFGIYIGLVGVLLTFFPNPLLGMMNVPSTSEVWIHLAGMLLVFMGFFYVQAGRKNVTEFFKWTIVTRLSAAVFVIGFVLADLISPVIILFWLGDLAGAIWTAMALKREGISIS
jgi:hypothetical protein